MSCNLSECAVTFHHWVGASSSAGKMWSKWHSLGESPCESCFAEKLLFLVRQCLLSKKSHI